MSNPHESPERPAGGPFEPGKPVSPQTSAGNVAGGHVPKGGKLKSRHVTMITLGGIIGASLFVGSGNVIRSVGPAAVLSYLIGGLLVFFAMRMLGEMAAARPTTGSFMEYARRSLGDWAGYFVGWLYWYFWVGVIAYEAVVGGSILTGWMPAVPQWAFSVILMLIFTATNLISLRSFGEVEFWLASVKVAAIVVFLGIGVLFVFGLWPGATFSIPNLWEHGGFAPNGAWAIVSGVAVVIFSYFGTEIAVMAASESENPVKGVRQATSTIIWRILIFFVGAVFLMVMIVPWDELPSPKEIGPFAYIFGLFGLPGAQVFMSAIILTAVCSVLNSGLYSAARMFSALADEGLAPKLIAKRSKSGVPTFAVIASTIGAYAAVIANFVAPESGIFDFIMNSAGLVALFVYVFIALTQMRMRAQMTPAEREALQLKMWLHPWLAILVIVGVVGVVAVMLMSGESGQVQVWTSLIAVAALAVFWPLVNRGLKRRAETERDAEAHGAPHVDHTLVGVHDPGVDEREHGIHQ